MNKMMSFIEHGKISVNQPMIRREALVIITGSVDLLKREKGEWVTAYTLYMVIV